MAGVTHSAFRRLVADFGGYDALFTEMILGKAVLHRQADSSPFSRKRECEGEVVFQLLLTGEEDIPAIVGKLSRLGPAGLDLNAACPAPEVRKYGSGFSLFLDPSRFRRVLNALRRNWPGPLSVKVRLGNSADSWRRHFFEILSIAQAEGVDFIVLHPRFADEKLKRPARWDVIPEVRQACRIPLVVNGDIVSLADFKANPCTLGLADGLMIGRMAAVKPWIFAECNGGAPDISYSKIWEKFYDYVLEDFPEEQVLGHLKVFSAYFARNFFFGHLFISRIQHLNDHRILREHALEFLGGDPQTSLRPSLAAI
jgi:tRNA-dihydrouridine synthase